ncbi:MAG: 3-oxoacyl-[acyl-carrier-protein] reductase [Candidatus Neomarinimicrobiota bacterium]|nr:3-oxoacyl-[acyl-carrier-protein] reductase [Candidatus Neomarinimicrobiota bacterium]
MPESRSAFVTGASRGIGLAIAKLFALSGIKVTCASRTIKALEQVVSEIQSSGGEAHAIKLDVSNMADFSRAVVESAEKFGEVDILVNNAGIVKDNLLLRMKEDDWDSVIDINLKGCFNGIKAVTPLMMKKRSGRIINVSSVSGMMGNAGQANYSAAKAGMIGLTKTIARELSSRNITVNAIAPGYIATDMTSDLSEKVKEDLIKHIPLGRIGNAEEIAATALFLCSDAAGYITGQTIAVNGGLYM